MHCNEARGQRKRERERERERENNFIIYSGALALAMLLASTCDGSAGVASDSCQSTPAATGARAHIAPVGTLRLYHCN